MSAKAQAESRRVRCAIGAKGKERYHAPTIQRPVRSNAQNAKAQVESRRRAKGAFIAAVAEKNRALHRGLRRRVLIVAGLNKIRKYMEAWYE